MSQSPSSAGAMGIGNVLNTKGVASTVQSSKPEAHGLPQHPQLMMDRAGSPHGSEHSRYSGPMHISYPSPTAMGAPLPLPQMANASLGAVSMGLPLPPPSVIPGMNHPSAYNPPKAPHQPPKAYPCSTCGKRFARRSDLARHGKFEAVLGRLLPEFDCSSLTDRFLPRAYPQRCSSSRVRLSWMWQAIHPTLRPDRAYPRAHRREASPMRAMWQGKS